jgi:hypothetical protein
VIALVLAAALLSPSLTLDTPNLAYGETITLTGTYGKVYHGRQPQLPNQPQVQVNCELPDGSGWQANQWTTNKVSLGNGWSQSTYAITLGGTSNGAHWTSGAASCSAALFYFDADLTLHVLAATSFEVAP